MHLAQGSCRFDPSLALDLPAGTLQNKGFLALAESMCGAGTTAAPRSNSGPLESGDQRAFNATEIVAQRYKRVARQYA